MPEKKLLPNCFPRKKGTAVAHVLLKIIMKISGGGEPSQLSIQKFLFHQVSDFLVPWCLYCLHIHDFIFIFPIQL